MPLTSRTRKRFLDCSGMDLAEAEQYGELLAELQRDVHFMLGDLARYVEVRFPERHHQAFPEWVSPGLLARTAAVAKAYPQESDRQIEATYTQYMRVANQPDRIARLEAIVEAGQTTDESAKPATGESSGKRWLLAFDVHFFTHRHFFSGAEVETAMQVSEWIQRTVERLREKGATDCVCAFEGRGSARKELVESAGWEDRYKQRPPKPDILIQQLNLVRELLNGLGFLCVSVDGYEADDILASYAAQFDGNVTIVSSDKDMRQTLSGRVNMLTDVVWEEDPHTGEVTPNYQWMTVKILKEATGLTPCEFVEYQTIAGDNVDGIRGVEGIGEKGERPDPRIRHRRSGHRSGQSRR